MAIWTFTLLIALAAAPVLGQFPRPSTFTSILKSPVDANITISYKEPETGTCTTVYESQKQYSGYINIPPFTLAPIQQNYNINTFFWFVEARQSPETAPLTIWLNGGPGSSSMIGFFQENGPCEVVQLSDGTYGTQSRMWGWDRISNVLFIDQPNQVGFSYDTPTNFSADLIHGTYNPPGPVPSGIPSFAYLNGTYPTQSLRTTANTTQIAAHAMYHFLQGWLSAFPQYNPGIRPNSTDTGPTEVNLFVESYGGQYGPVFAYYLEQMNEMRANGTLDSNNTLEISLASLGIVNGMIDAKIQFGIDPKFAANNTYGIAGVTQLSMYNTMTAFDQPGGCSQMIDECRTGQSMNAYGDDVDVDYICAAALTQCTAIQNVYANSGLSFYDIRQEFPSPFPSESYLEYLNSGQVMQSLGVQVNYTESSNAVYDNFGDTGDEISYVLPDLAALLAKDIRVALIYGDADYILNWYGGEAVSLALAQIAHALYATNFPAAGYAELVVNSTYVGGEVRQYGNLSFTRVYDAGHQVPAYQPETAFQVFARVIYGTSLSTGQPISLTTYQTSGPQNSTYANKPGQSLNPVCWIRAINTTCTSSQQSAIAAGKGVVLNGAWYENSSEYTPPASTVSAGKPGTPLPNSTASVSGTGSSGVAPTGVYIATATPTPTKAAGSVVRVSWLPLLVVVVAILGAYA